MASVYSIVYLGETTRQSHVMVNDRKTIEGFYKLFEHHPELEEMIQLFRVIDELSLYMDEIWDQKLE